MCYSVFITRSVADSSRSRTACNFISLTHSGGGWIISDTSPISPASSWLDIHVTPFRQKVLLTIDKGFTPLDARSPGFSTPGTWGHISVGKRCLISATLWLTNCFRYLSFLLIQYRIFFESVQQRTRSTTWHCSSAVLIRAVNFASIHVPKSFSLGMVYFFNGVIRVFDAINRTWVLVWDIIV